MINELFGSYLVMSKLFPLLATEERTLRTSHTIILSSSLSPKLSLLWDFSSQALVLPTEYYLNNIHDWVTHTYVACSLPSSTITLSAIDF
jgi:hypothetical protein